MMYSIYCFTNKVNNKSYIGLTSNLKARKYAHIKSASSGKRNSSFHRAIKKYGIENFSFVVIETCNSLKEANEAETLYISLFMTKSPNGYNLTGGGDCPKLVEESVKKRSGDNAINKIINSSIASQLYDDYLSDVYITTYDLAVKYKISESAVCNILHKRAWKDANIHKPNIDFSLRIINGSGDKSKNKKITSTIAREVYLYRLNNPCSFLKLASKFGLTKYIVRAILLKRSWKKSTIDLPDIDIATEGKDLQKKSRKISTHGSGHMYNYYKCRCTLCKEWRRNNKKKYK